jgi:hypothetical protein
MGPSLSGSGWGRGEVCESSLPGKAESDTLWRESLGGDRLIIPMTARLIELQKYRMGHMGGHR